MLPQTFNFIPALPEIFLLSMICVVVLADLFGKHIKSLTYGLTQCTLIVTALLVGWLFSKSGTVIFSGTYIWDGMAGVLKIFVLTINFFAFLYARDYIRQRSILEGEYYILGLFSTLGMLVLVSSYSFLTVYLGLELTSLPLYAMVACQRGSATGTEAAMKYFVMGAIASAMLLYGMSMVYGATHSLNIGEIAASVLETPPLQQLILIFGLVFIIVGIAFKFGAVPFHMWVPDVYQGAPTSVTLFIGAAPKVAALGFAVRLLVDALPDLASQWQSVLIVMAVSSIALGNIVAIVQSNLKRMLSYSAIAHVGYMLLGLLTANSFGYGAAMFYMIIYAVMSLGAFALLILMSKNGVDVEKIHDLKGLNARSPWLAFMMLLVMFSMAGIPPTVGFFAKLGILEALVNVHKVWLASFALVFAIIGAYYYLNVVKVMYFEEPEDTSPIIASFDTKVAISINGLAMLGLGLFPSGLIEACRYAFSLWT